ncbi:hypothetical protein LY76DRAFT_586704 [Colletotrichum caudatum]|nr:hypothetical protein LY76DRAFT_586704 [Colletotrichum caudatum]
MRRRPALTPWFIPSPAVLIIILGMLCFALLWGLFVPLPPSLILYFISLLSVGFLHLPTQFPPR